MKNIKDYLVGIIFLIIGIIFGIIITVMKISENKFINNSIETIGIIENIRYNYSTFDDNDSIDVIISYQDKQGKKYTNKSDYYSSNMQEGEKITVYYSKDNPNKFIVKKADFFNYIFYGMSSLFIILGIILIIIPYIKKKKGLNLRYTGIKLMATITSVSLNKSYNINGKSPYVIYANYIYNDLVYEAKSNNIWYEVEYILNTYQIKELPIFINPTNPKKYYLDINEIEEHLGK